MGLRGRPKKPQELAILHGDFKKNPQRLNKNAPLVSRELPICPEHLDDIARERWQFVVTQLTNMQLQSLVDGPLIEQYCRAYSQWRKMLKLIDEHGYTVSTSDGAEKVSPYVTIEGRLWDQMERALGKFGFNPSARSSLYVQKRPDSGVLRRAK